METLTFWVLKDTVTNKFYIDAGLTLGELNDAVIHRTVDSMTNGIKKRISIMKKDHKHDVPKKSQGLAGKWFYELITKRMYFANQRITLPFWGIEAVKFTVSV